MNQEAEKNVLKIIVVDDEPDAEYLFLQRFRKELKRGDVQFEFFQSAEATLDYLTASSQIDIVLVLSDINMPGMNGIELLDEVKKVFPQLLVYMITAYGDKQTEALARKKGADDFLTKPVDFSSLKAKILAIQAN